MEDFFRVAAAIFFIPGTVLFVFFGLLWHSGYEKKYLG